MDVMPVEGQRGQQLSTPPGVLRFALPASVLALAAAAAVAMFYLGETPPLAPAVLLSTILILLVGGSLASGAAVVLAARSRRSDLPAETAAASMPLMRFLVIGPLIGLAWAAGILPSAHAAAPLMAGGEFLAVAFATNVVCDWLALRRLRRAGRS